MSVTRLNKGFKIVFPASRGRLPRSQIQYNSGIGELYNLAMPDQTPYLAVHCVKGHVITLKVLEDKGLVERADRRWSFREPLFHMYVQGLSLGPA